MTGEQAAAWQRRYWNSPATAPWVALQDRLDTFFAGLARAAIAAAAPAPGEAALDVGCGCGATVLELARRVGAAGRVEGIDISAPMLDRARDRVAAEGLAQASLTLADATTHAFPAGGFDLVFSRLGVMFFADPVAAFANLHCGLKPGGRLAVLCCRDAAENDFISTAVRVARPLLPPDAVPVPPPDAPGMFSLADPVRVRRILGAAGFAEIGMAPYDQGMRLAGPGEAAEAAAFSLAFGPLTRVLDEVAPTQRQAILDAGADAYRQKEGPESIVLGGAFWIVTARA